MATVDVLVAGATGNTGRPIVEELLARGASVRAMLRSPGGAGSEKAETVVADFDDIGSIRTALDGVRRAYLVTPSSDRAERQQIDFVDAAQDAGVERLVVLSQLAARADSPVRFLRYHAAVEQHVRDSGLDFTFLRPNLYYQGLLALAGIVADSGVLPAPIGDATVSAVDVRDIAAVAAAALTEDGHSRATYTITGPEALTHAAMAAALADATGREIRFVDVSPEDFAAGLHGVLTPWQVDGLLEDYAHYSRGEASEVTTAVPDVTGRPAAPFARFAAEHADAFSPR